MNCKLYITSDNLRSREYPKQLQNNITARHHHYMYNTTMKICLALLFAATVTMAHANGASNDGDDGHLRRRLIVVDPAYAPPQICEDGKAAQHTLEMKIFTDNYPEETMFWISEVDKPYDAVLKHTQFTLKNTIHSLSTKVCETSFKANVKDTYGDGLCCAYGEGYFKIFVDGQMQHKGGEFGKLETVDFSVEPMATPQDFYGWDGRSCVKKNGEPGEKNKEYKVFNLNFEDCMHKACEEGFQGFQYEDDECHVWIVSPRFETKNGAICFARKFTSLAK